MPRSFSQYHQSAVHNQVAIRQPQNVATRQTTAISGAKPIVSISPALQQKVFELHCLIRRELGNGNYALIGKDSSAVLCGVEKVDFNALAASMGQPAALVPPVHGNKMIAGIDIA